LFAAGICGDWEDDEDEDELLLSADVHSYNFHADNNHNVPRDGLSNLRSDSPVLIGANSATSSANGADIFQWIKTSFTEKESGDHASDDSNNDYLPDNISRSVDTDSAVVGGLVSRQHTESGVNSSEHGGNVPTCTVTSQQGTAHRLDRFKSAWELGNEVSSVRSRQSADDQMGGEDVVICETLATLKPCRNEVDRVAGENVVTRVTSGTPSHSYMQESDSVGVVTCITSGTPTTHSRWRAGNSVTAVTHGVQLDKRDRHKFPGPAGLLRRLVCVCSLLLSEK
jgi:hypothetical protein